MAEWVLIFWMLGFREPAMISQTFTSFDRCDKARQSLRETLIAVSYNNLRQINGLCVQR